MRPSYQCPGLLLLLNPLPVQAVDKPPLQLQLAASLPGRFCIEVELNLSDKVVVAEESTMMVLYIAKFRSRSRPEMALVLSSRGAFLELLPCICIWMHI